MTTTKHPDEHLPLLPFLVQRVQRCKVNADTRKGVDRYFSMDYMGSAEFEYGALPATLKVLRTLTLPPPIRINSVREGQPVTAWYVGPETHRMAIAYWFQHCVATEKGQYEFDNMKEMPRVWDAYGPEFQPLMGGKPPRNYGRNIVGWWCVDAGGDSTRRNGCWAIFRDKTDATNWLKGLKG